MSAALDLDRLAKVRALMDRGANEHERSAARSRAEAIAARAGMTLDSALAKLYGTAQAKSNADFMAAWRKAQADAQRRREAEERDRKRRERQEAFLKEFGSEEAIFAETRRERLLRITLQPLADYKTVTNSRERYIDGFAGWTSGRPNKMLWDALDTAYPLPDTLTAAWEEYRWWERLTDARCAFEEYYEPPPHIRARQYALEHLLDTITEPTFDGFTVRLEWLAWCNEHSVWRFQEENAVMLKRMISDFAMLREITEDRMRPQPRPRRKPVNAAQGDLFG